VAAALAAFKANTSAKAETTLLQLQRRLAALRGTLSGCRVLAPCTPSCMTELEFWVPIIQHALRKRTAHAEKVNDKAASSLGLGDSFDILNSSFHA
jgi:hypothetical protein